MLSYSFFEGEVDFSPASTSRGEGRFFSFGDLGEELFCFDESSVTLDSLVGVFFPFLADASPLGKLFSDSVVGDFTNVGSVGFRGGNPIFICFKGAAHFSFGVDTLLDLSLLDSASLGFDASNFSVLTDSLSVGVTSAI